MLDLESTIALLEQAKGIFAAEPNYIELPSDKPIVVVGDVHGDLETVEDIVRKYAGLCRFVFLGDYINRPPQDGSSLKTILYLLELKTKHPEDFILLRGNNEFAKMFQDFVKYPEFTNEVKEAYGRGWLQFGVALEKVFVNLPYVAATENGVLMLHGGLPLFVDSLDDLKQLPKSVRDCKDNPVVSQIVWNDHYWPESGVEIGQEGYAKNTYRSKKGTITAYVYGQEIFEEVMAKLGMQILIRGHNAHATGPAFDNRLVTIHTCRRNANEGPMKGAYIAVIEPDRDLMYPQNPRLVQVYKSPTNRLPTRKILV